MKPYTYKLLLLLLFTSCYNENRDGATNDNTSAINTSSFQAKGDSIGMKTFDTLRNTLLAAIKEKGIEQAVAFCNINALQLTNSYAQNNIIIKRTSDKLRNPANAPDTMEQRVLVQLLSNAENATKPKSLIEEDAAGNVHYYKQIIMQPLCLNCHGNSLQVQPGTMEMIKSKYPKDAAVGYKEGDVRGLWHVVFLKEATSKTRYSPANNY